MAKFSGIIGYVTTFEKEPGLWVEEIIEKECIGDLLKNTRIIEGSSEVNDSINISNEVSIIADPYASSNFHTMRYIKFMGATWKISNVEVLYPRLKLTIGGLYNGEQA